ncbi:MAG: hypothetical protein AB8G15_19710 [Saprospiraceae bacterium]
MAELPQNTSIQDAAYALTEQVDFQYLKQLGLDAIIRTASEKWTDYNEHDPGITILEVLVYALTDLGYRTDFPITDLLAQAQASVSELSKNEFYTARTILSVNAVSLDDYRRVIIDLEEVANAWVLPSNDQLNPFTGLLDIWVNASDKIETAASRKALKQQVRVSFFEHRSLSQDLVNITIRKKLNLRFKMQLILDPKKVKEVERTLAQVLLAIKSYLSEEIYFCSLEQMMIKTDSDVNAIFNGPALVHGFLPTDALQPMVCALNVVKLIPIIQKILGVVMISNLAFKTSEGARNWLKKLAITPENRLVLGTLFEQELTVLLGDTPYPINRQRLEFEYKKALHQQANSKLAKAERDLPIVLGDFRDTETYFSIQNEFPTIYGLEPFGPPPDASKQHLAQIQQLKSYLLIFDQIMANYLAQLSHLSDLFSWSREVQQTYFFQGLSGAVGEIEQLLVDENVAQSPTQDAADILVKYQAKLAGFTEDKATFLSRRNRFLDHLLARFGRQLIFENRHLKFELTTVKEQEEVYAIDAKLRVLEQYPDLSANRARAFNLEAKDFSKAFSGLRNWVETLFFMEPETMEKFRFNQRFQKRSYNAAAAKKELIYSESEFIFKTVKPAKEPKGPKPVRPELDLNEIMRIGVHSENYYIDHKEKIGHRIYLYKQTEVLQAATIYELTKKYKTPKEAFAAIDQVVKLLQRYDRSSESIYVIEQLLLRPMDNEPYFGLDLLDEKAAPWMETKGWYSKTALDEIKAPLSSGQSYYEIIDASNPSAKRSKKNQPLPIEMPKFSFSIKPVKNAFGETDFKLSMRYYATDGFVVFKGINSYVSIVAAEKSIEAWMTSYKLQMKNPALTTLLYKGKLSPWVKWNKNKSKKKKVKHNPAQLHLDIDVFSNVLTIVLPEWPSRFQRKGFKTALDQRIRTEAPAHLWLNILWLEKSKFQKFQRLFGPWWNAYREGARDAYTYREKIANFLVKESYDQLSKLT